MRKLLYPLLLSPSLALASIQVDVTPYNSICYAGQPCQVGAVHSIKIINDTPVDQTYHWVFALNADNGDNVSKGDFVKLKPGEEFRQNNFRNIGYMKFNMPGRKMLHCTSQADGYEHNKIMKDGYVDVR